MNMASAPQDLNVSELSRRRRAIYAGLLNCMDEDQALQGTRLWNREFAHTPLYAVQSFLSRLYEELDLNISRAELQRKILQALVREVHDLPEDPLRDSRPESSSTFSQTEASHKVFTYFMDYLLEAMDKARPGLDISIKVYILDHAHHAGIQGATLNSIKAWLAESGQANLIRNLHIDQMRGLFHYAYVAACEHLGPVMTDKLVGETVRIVDQFPEASIFSPRKLF